MNSEEMKLLLDLADGMNVLTNNVQKIVTDMQELKGDVKIIDRRLTSVENTIEKIDARLTSVELTIENEISKSIKILAEGHMGLAEKAGNMHDDIEEIKDSVSILKFVQHAMAKKS